MLAECTLPFLYYAFGPKPEVPLFVPLVAYNYYMFYRLTTIMLAKFFLMYKMCRPESSLCDILS